jgi:hypothetical protein
MANDTAAARAVRLRHYQGQRLQAADLQDEYDNLSQLRGLHVVGLHDTWGIALGYAVQLGPTNSNTVLVGPGLAYDCRGREIVLTQNRIIAGPHVGTQVPQGAVYVLVMAYDADLGARQAGQEWILCGDGAAGREQPAFAWRRANAVRLGLEVPLLAVQIADGAIVAGSLDQSVRRHAQPLARPHIGAGITPREQRWTPWRDAQTEALLGVQTWVDTREAGFVGTPYYIAGLYLPPTIIEGIAGRLAFYLFTSLADPSASGFWFRVMIALANDARFSGFSLNNQRLGLFSLAAAATPQPPTIQVSWLGVEPVDGCAPPVNWVGILHLIERRFQASALLGRRFGTMDDRR